MLKSKAFKNWIEEYIGKDYEIVKGKFNKKDLVAYKTKIKNKTIKYREYPNLKVVMVEIVE